MPLLHHSTALAVATLVLAGCRIDVGQEAVPEDHHQMPDGSLMANRAPSPTFDQLAPGDEFLVVGDDEHLLTHLDEPEA